jgi:hypothetical protein
MKMKMVYNNTNKVVRMFAGQHIYQHRRFACADGADDSHEDRPIEHRRDYVLVDLAVAHECRRLHSER